jgi:hypothetical protein
VIDRIMPSRCITAANDLRTAAGAGASACLTYAYYPARRAESG